MDSWQLLFELIGIAVCGKAPTAAVAQACEPQTLEMVYAYAAKHDLAHLVGQAAGKLQTAEYEALEKCKNAALAAFVRHARQEYALRKLCDILEQGEVPFIPLKGAVLRQWYPEAWMRTGCDVDVLVREADLDQAQALLEAENWRFAGRGSHDLSFLSPEGVHLELHFSTIEDCISEKGKAVMDGIWQDAKPLPGKRCHMEISDGLFYFYHMAHMAKHMLTGGCGIRSFLDVWILNHRVEADTDSRKHLLQQGGLTAFAKAAERLAEIWFSGASMDEYSKPFETFVLHGGTYGTLENQVRMQQAKKGSRLRFVWERIFLPHCFLKHSYPVLQKHKWLTPVFWVVRWFRLLFDGKVGRSAVELQTAAAVSEGTNKEIGALLRYLEL